jgi:hypothetical protein
MRREWCDQARDPIERRRAGIQRQPPGGIDTVEKARPFQGNAISLADFQLIERDRFRPEAKLCDQRLQFLARRQGVADIQRQLRFVRPLGLRPRKRPHEGCGGIEIETF